MQTKWYANIHSLIMEFAVFPKLVSFSLGLEISFFLMVDNSVTQVGQDHSLS